MKTINVTDETYTALLSLGVIKEEQKFESIGLRNDGTIIAKPKELKPWEKYPTLESCWSDDEKLWDVCNDGEIYSTIPQKKYCYMYSTEAEAKKARATIFLSRIARKWNEGSEVKDRYYFPLKNGENIKADGFEEGSYLGNALPFKFHTRELAEKSLELFPDVWNDFYGR